MRNAPNQTLFVPKTAYWEGLLEIEKSVFFQMTKVIFTVNCIEIHCRIIRYSDFFLIGILFWNFYNIMKSSSKRMDGPKLEYAFARTMVDILN